MGCLLHDSAVAIKGGAGNLPSKQYNIEREKLGRPV